MNKVRKNWLIAFYVFHVGWFLFALIDTFLGKAIDGVFRMNTGTALALFSFIYPLLNGVSAYFTYAYSFIGNGTKWLTSMMVIVSLWMLLVLDSFLANVLKDGYFERQPIFHMVFQVQESWRFT